MPKRDLHGAVAAYKNRDTEQSRIAHDARVEEPHQNAQGKYIKSIVYGGLDGIITTFAVVAGVAGASLNAGVVLILGFANLIADGLSMAIGDYLSTKAENEYNRAERERETWEVENYPEGERRELVELYEEKGLSTEQARTVVDIISTNKKAWIDIMMVEELGIIEDGESPVKNAVATFVSFGLFGFVPLVAYVVSYAASTQLPGLAHYNFPVASVLTGLTLFTLGALKVKITGKRWWLAGLEMFIVGGLAALAAYGIGHALAGLAPD